MGFMEKEMLTRVPLVVYRRVSKLAKHSGLSRSKWLRQVATVASQDSDVARQIRSLVAQSLMIHGKE